MNPRLLSIRFSRGQKPVKGITPEVAVIGKTEDAISVLTLGHWEKTVLLVLMTGL